MDSSTIGGVQAVSAWMAVGGRHGISRAGEISSWPAVTTEKPVCSGIYPLMNMEIAVNE